MSDRADIAKMREAWPLWDDRLHSQGALAARAIHSLCDEVEALRVALTEHRAPLAKYGRHLVTCQLGYDVRGGYDDPRPCDCGLGGWLAADQEDTR